MDVPYGDGALWGDCGRRGGNRARGKQCAGGGEEGEKCEERSSAAEPPRM